MEEANDMFGSEDEQLNLVSSLLGYLTKKPPL